MKEPEQQPPSRSPSELEIRAMFAIDDLLRELRAAVNNRDADNTLILAGRLLGALDVEPTLLAGRL